MPEKETIERAHEDAAEGKSASTQAGEFVREEMHHIREGKHGAANTKQAIAIGLSKARRAGVKLGAPNPRTTSAETRKKAEQDSRKGRSGAGKHPSPRRSRATLGALKREPHKAASRESLSRQAHSSAARRGSRARHESAEAAVRTKGPTKMSQASKKAARTRSRNRRAA
ncbi:MAG: DNA-binding protein [Acidobacteria bacterium]|nr:DNA-binding protein [Acidobacteriota bacterium]